MNGRILYIGWVGFGNHGDDICVDIFSRRFRQAEVIPIFPSRFDELASARLNPSLVVLGAGSLLELIYLEPLHLAQQAGIPTVIWGSGYDSAGEGMEIPSDLAYALRQIVPQVHAVGVRGPLTLQALQEIGAVHAELSATGDPGLLWAPDPSEETPTEQIAVNWGTAYNNVLGRDEPGVAAQLAKVLRALTEKFRLLIYPVWRNDIASCRALAEAVGRPEQVDVLDRVPLPEELAHIYRSSLLSINMKLHANVFSAALDCPFVALAYRWKCVDFAESVGCRDFCILFNDPHFADRLLDAVTSTAERLNQRKRLLSQQVTAAQKRTAALEKKIAALL